MFTSAVRRKVNIFIQDPDIEPVTVALDRLESLELSEGAPQDDWFGSRPESWREAANAYADQTRRLEELLQTLQISRQDEPPPAQVQPRREAEQPAGQLREIEPAIQIWQERRAEVEDKLEQLYAYRENLNRLETLDLPVAEISDLEYLHLRWGAAPAQYLDRLRIPLARTPFVIMPLSETRDEDEAAEVLILAATDQPHAPILNQALQTFFFQPLDLPQETNRSPAQAAAQLERQIEQAEQEAEDLEQERRRLTQEWADPLLQMWSRAAEQARLAGQISRFGRRDDFYLIEGYIAGDQGQVLEQTVAEAAHHPYAILLVQT